MPDAKEKAIVPRLRFPEFRDAGPWEVKRLGEVCRITNGSSNAQDHEHDGVYPLFDRSEIVKKSNKFLFDCEAVIIPGEGMRFIPKYFIGKFDLHQRAYALMDFHGSGRFVYYQMDALKNELSNKAVMSTVLSLRMPILEGFRTTFPSIEEQQKIADCLSSLDDLIRAEEAQLAALKDHKKGLMQQLFPVEGETTPRLRFPEFRDAGSWEVCGLNDLEKLGIVELGRGQVISQKDMELYPGTFPVYSSSVKNDGLMGRYGRYMFDEELITWSIDGGGDFFYRPKHKFSVTNVCGFIRLDTVSLNYRFLAGQLQRLHALKSFDYVAKAHPSVIRGLYQLAIPSLLEQQKIADCLASLDDLIRARTEHIDALKQHKKGLMQQLFPQQVG